MKYISFLLLFLGTSTFLFAQPVNKSSNDQLIEAGEIAESSKNYYSAVESYQTYYKEDKDLDIAFKIANLHYKMRNYAKAENWFMRIVNKRSTKKRKNNYMPEARFEYAKMLKYNGKYVEAKQEFQLYISEAEDLERINAAKLEVVGIELAMEMQDEEGITVMNAGKKVNSKSAEASPYMRNGELYFAGRKRSEVLVLDGSESDTQSKIFVASKTDDGFGEPVAIEGDNIPRQGYDLGNLALSPDGERMYFTRAQLDGNELASSELFFSTKGSEGWGPAYALDKINGDYIVRHPAVGELYNKEVLFFASNREGGFGGYDLYYSTRDGEGFGAPVNLGESINTASDDITPYYVDGTLYFSTEGRPSLGGFDVYRSVWNGSEWSAPENIGKPYNSSVDDLYFNIDEEGYEGFVVSNRVGTTSMVGKTCCDDIWIVNKEKIILELLANILDENGKALNGSKVKLLTIQENAVADTKSKTLADANSASFPLLTDKAYRIIANVEGYIPDTLNFNTVSVDKSQVFTKNIKLRKIPPPPPPPVEDEYEEYTINEPIRLNNIYYDYDDDKILTDAEQDLSIILELMNQYTDMVIELGSHTDSRGGPAYNENLSQRRAESAKRWLVERNINPDRIQAKGYGESVILNQCVEGVTCTDEEHRFNRRTEFKIISGPKTIQIKKTRLIKKGN